MFQFYLCQYPSRNKSVGVSSPSVQTFFRAEARRNKLLGLWAAGLMGKSGDAANAYAMDVVASDFIEAGDEDVFRKLSGDLGGLADTATIRAKMAELAGVAKSQLMTEL